MALILFVTLFTFCYYLPISLANNKVILLFNLLLAISNSRISGIEKIINNRFISDRINHVKSEYKKITKDPVIIMAIKRTAA